MRDVVGVSCHTVCDKSDADLLPRLMTPHPQDKADKSIRAREKGVGFVTIAKRICYNDKKDLLHQDGCMGVAAKSSYSRLWPKQKE